MRLIKKTDGSLVVGLIAGTVVIFQRPLRLVWEAAWNVQERYQVDLLPALAILVGVMVFHEARKRQQARAERLAALADAARARMRSEELERLMTFGQALANSLDIATLQQALWRYLPAFTGERECWILARRAARWDSLLREPTAALRGSVDEREALAGRLMTPETLEAARFEGVLERDMLCFPMVAGDTLGVLGIHDGATLNDDQRQALGVATGLIAIAMKNVQQFLESQESSLRDSLTGCVNRGHGLDTLERELVRARRSQQPLSILLFDIDRFKTINDELGHLRGDDLLRAVGAQLTRVLRSADVKCRYGGDEFLIILPDTPLSGAQQAGESVRRKIASLKIAADGKTIPVTVSIGVATAGLSDAGAAELLDQADRGLYQAKREGRNRCGFAGAATARAPLDAPVTSLQPAVLTW